MNELHNASGSAMEAALRLFNVARKIHQATLFAQPADRLARLPDEIAEATAQLAILAELYPAPVAVPETNVRRLSERARRERAA